MLKIKDKSIYDETVNSMIKDYEKTVKEKPLTDKDSRESMEVIESVVQVIDNVVNTGMHCKHDDMLKSRIHLVMTIMGAMLASECQRYYNEEIKKTVEKSIGKISDNIEDLIKDLLEALED